MEKIAERTVRRSTDPGPDELDPFALGAAHAT
jgi:hypothetical protein